MLGTKTVQSRPRIIASMLHPCIYAVHYWKVVRLLVASSLARHARVDISWACHGLLPSDDERLASLFRHQQA